MFFKKWDWNPDFLTATPPTPTQARVHSAEPCCPFSFPNTTWGFWRVLWTRSTLSRLHAFAPAVPPAWHVLPGRTLPNKLPPPSRGSGSIPPGRLTQIRGPGWWVNFWYLSHCEIYVSACPFDSRLPEGKDSFLFISVSQQPAQGRAWNELSINVIALN